MATLTRRSLLRYSVGFAAAGALARPYIISSAGDFAASMSRHPAC
jgi:hypothetical protein